MLFILILYWVILIPVHSWIRYSETFWNSHPLSNGCLYLGGDEQMLTVQIAQDYFLQSITCNQSDNAQRRRDFSCGNCEFGKLCKAFPFCDVSIYRLAQRGWTRSEIIECWCQPRQLPVWLEFVAYFIKISPTPEVVRMHCAHVCRHGRSNVIRNKLPCDCPKFSIVTGHKNSTDESTRFRASVVLGSSTCKSVSWILVW